MIRIIAASAMLASTAVLAASAIGTINKFNMNTIPLFTETGQRCAELNATDLPAEGLPILEENRDVGILKITPQNNNSECVWVMMFHVSYESNNKPNIVECTHVAMASPLEDPAKNAPAVSSGWGETCGE